MTQTAAAKARAAWQSEPLWLRELLCRLAGRTDLINASALDSEAAMALSRASDTAAWWLAEEMLALGARLAPNRAHRFAGKSFNVRLPGRELDRSA